ncbi:unnamed protein product, partial [Closterium sp. NIES-54]
LGSAVGGGSPLPLGLRFAVLRVLLDARLFPTCFPVRSSGWRPLVRPVAPGRLASSARPGPVARLERGLMDFLGALGHDCAVEVDPAPRPLPLVRPAASVPIAPPMAADEIRRRFEDQRRDLGLLGGGSLPLGEPARAGSGARSGAEAVAHRERSPRHHSPAARDTVPVTTACIATVLPLPAPLVRDRLLAMRLDIGPWHHVLPLLRNASGSTLLVALSVPLTASVSGACLAHSRLSVRARVDVRIVGDGGGYGRGGAARPAPSAMERVLKKLDGVEKALHRSHAGSSSQSAPPAAPVAPLAALLPHNPVGSLARSAHPLPAGTGFVGAGGGDPWAQFALPRPLPAPRDLAVSARRSRASAFPPQMKPVPTATLAHLWSLAECLKRSPGGISGVVPVWHQGTSRLCAQQGAQAGSLLRFRDRRESVKVALHPPLSLALSLSRSLARSP